MSKSVREITKELVEPILKELGLDLDRIEYAKEGRDWFLRVFVDKPEGVSIDECSIVSEQLSEKLDEHDPIKGAYFLEVSSPGVERPLKTKEDFKNHLNQNAHVSLYKHIDGHKEFEGVIKSFENDVLTIEYRELSRLKEVEIPFELIAKARRAVSL